SRGLCVPRRNHANVDVDRRVAAAIADVREPDRRLLARGIDGEVARDVDLVPVVAWVGRRLENDIGRDALAGVDVLRQISPRLVGQTVERAIDREVPARAEADQVTEGGRVPGVVA